MSSLHPKKNDSIITISVYFDINIICFQYNLDLCRFCFFLYNFLVYKYGAECLAVKGQNVQEMNATEIRMLRWMCNHNKMDSKLKDMPTSGSGTY